MTDPIVLLRRAADRVRALAEAATPGVCPGYVATAVSRVAHSVDVDCGHPGHDDAPGWSRRGDGPYLAAMHRGVGLVMAEVLEAWAHMAAVDPDALHRVGGPETLALARQVLNGEGATR
jgi:hypothetical protein